MILQKRSLIIAIMAGCTISLSGCAAMTRAIAKSECNESAAYAHGFNQGRDNDSMSSNYAGICKSIEMDQGQIDQLNEKYREGYQAGMQVYLKDPQSHAHHYHHRPDGSYLKTCRDINWHHRSGQLSAQCRRKSGGYHYSHLDFDRCLDDYRYPEVANDNGRLICHESRNHHF